MPEHPLELRLFGPPAVRVNGQDERVNLKKLLGLVAYLALEGTTTRSKLAGLLWSDVDEDAARRNLRRELVRVKTHASVLEGRFTSEGERLRLTEPWSSDAQAFSMALERDDLEAALEHYRGPLLDGLEIAGAEGFHEWLEVKRQHYARLSRKASLDLAERLETKGDWRRALELHLGLLEEDALQERTHREVMRLHYLLGEREAALTQFERCRTVLGGELGLEPLPETVLLAERIRGMQTLEPISALAMPPGLAVEAPLVGRAAELEHLQALTGAVIVLGEPGVGKTRLLTEFAARQDTVWVRFSEHLSHLPLAAVAQTITDALQQPAGRKRLLRLEQAWRLEVARLVPEIEPDAEPISASGPEARARFLEGVARALIALGSCLILEDLHWADATSLELAHSLVPKLEGRRLLLSARPAELEGNEAAADLTTQLAWARELERIQLGPLKEFEVGVLVAHNARNHTGFGEAFVVRLMQATQGNPFFVLESLRYILEHPGSSENLPVPPSVREVVLERTKRLGNAARRLLETASLTDDGFTLREVQPATALSDWEGVDGLERAVGAQILRKLERGGYAFSHDLVRQAIAGNLGAERQTIIHGKLAQTLEVQNAAPARIARHLEGAGQPVQAAPWRVRAAEAARHVYAHQEALEQYAQALEDGADDHTAWLAHQGRGQILMLLVQLEPARTEFERLEVLARTIGDSRLLAEALLQQARLREYFGNHAEALERFQHLLETNDLPAAVQCRALIESALILHKLGRHGGEGEAETRLREALEIAPKEEYRLAAQAHGNLCLLLLKRQDYAAAEAHITTALTTSRAAGDRQLHAQHLSTAARLALAQGKRAEAIGLIDQAIEEARSIGDVNLHYVALVNAVRLHTEDGALDAARQRIEEGLALVSAPRDPRTEGTLQHRLGDVHVLQGQLGQAIEAYQASIICADTSAQLDQQRLRRNVLASLWTQLGDATGSLRLLAEIESSLEQGQEHHLYETARAALELLQGHTEAAIARLERRISEVGYGYREQNELAQCHLGAARLSRGDAVGALEITEGIKATVALTAMALTVRLRAHVTLGELPTKARAEAEALLSSARVPPLERLELRRAFAHALEFAGKSKDALKVRREARETLHQLAASLEDHPEVRMSFFELHHDLA